VHDDGEEEDGEGDEDEVEQLHGGISCEDVRGGGARAYGVAPGAARSFRHGRSSDPRASATTPHSLDAGIALRLYDFDVARYELRATRLRELLLARVLGPSAAADQLLVPDYVQREAAAAGMIDAAFVAAAFARARVEVALTPPPPPVLEVSADDDAVRGAADAPVTIIVFCDFQSPHCRPMQPVLRQLLAAYPTRVRLVERDFPLPIHRDAVRAAEAAECAREQDAYWPYHDVQSPSTERTAAYLARMPAAARGPRPGVSGRRGPCVRGCAAPRCGASSRPR
jgi:hypothetical protein